MSLPHRPASHRLQQRERQPPLRYQASLAEQWHEPSSMRQQDQQRREWLLQKAPGHPLLSPQPSPLLKSHFHLAQRVQVGPKAS
mmetsp:Transcript_92752/g.235941  ORF Transcript_92752/g.235941 Transcript_92752/m.235941 type:complete len:84 (-) Transcript_92752:763-1014(-)